MKKLFIPSIGLLSLIGSSIFAQSVISTAGGQLNGSSGYAFVCMGQTTFNVNKHAEGNENQGILYPYSKSFPTSKSLQKVSLTVHTFPNPTNNILYISCPSTENFKFRYTFISPKGNMLLSGTLQSTHSKIDISRFPAAIYILEITDTQKDAEHLTYKIIKND
ncbi:MAG: T9SS type A sorting domain-containing protein [Bacteroidales bacterium]|jgi:hypothetical protein|nr:T9SS type A sorting domain-containing protein [Bacteroidales bacterium]